jgi:hypothetical protein
MAMEVQAWQLYGATLAPDFHTMMRVLRVAEGAGKYISALAEVQHDRRVGWDADGWIQRSRRRRASATVARIRPVSSREMHASVMLWP